MAAGFSDGRLALIDFQKNRILQELTQHQLRIGCLEWNPKQPYILASGSKDRSIKILDTRQGKRVSLLRGKHLGEICGLSWNSNGY